MIVKDVLLMSAKYLDLREVCNYLSGLSDEANDQINEDIEKLLLSINIVCSNIASGYIELVNDAVINSVAKFVEYKAITDNNIIEIKNCYGENSAPIDYMLRSNGVESNSYISRISFSYFPRTVGLDDSIDFFVKLNIYTIAQGVISEYLFLKGDFEESYIWDEKFKNSLKSILRTKRNVVVPAKRWL